MKKWKIYTIISSQTQIWGKNMDEQIWYGKYKPLKLFSANGSTEVFLVEHILLGEKRVLKRTAKGTDSELLLRNEAKALLKVNSPYIPNLLDFLDEEKEVVIIEEYFEGTPLSTLLEQNTVFSSERIFGFACSLCYALSALHNCSGRLLHGDLSPSNVIVSGDVLKLIDFGTAGAAENGETSGKVFGTKGFCAPEQTVGELRSEKTDIYAAGKILFSLLERAEQKNVITKRGGIRQKSLENAEKKLLSGLYAIAEKASSELPSDRFDSVGEMLVMLKGCRDRKSIKELQPGRQNGPACTIGVMGTHHGVGVTHTALALASFLRRSGRRVAVVELSGQSALDCFGKQKESHGSPCSYKGLNVFPEADSLLAGTVRNGNYDYCILDLGCVQERRKQELFRCDVKLIVTDGAPWKSEKRKGPLEIFKEIESLKGWWLLVNFCENTVPADCRKLNVRTELLRFSPDPFETSGQDERLFGKILPAFRHTSISGLPL